MLRIIYPSLLLLLFPWWAMGQTSQVNFGKNRVQYHRQFDEWMKYESDNFVTYWYGDGRNVGQAVVQIAEQDFPFIQGVLEHRMNEKVDLIVYIDLTDLKQSNLGNEEVLTNTAGQTKFAGNKVFVYFNGDHTDLRRQVREGIAGVYLDAMLFGTNLQEIVQNAVLMNLPKWFTGGLVAYLGESWNTTLDNQLRQLLASGRYASFDELAVDHPRLAGHAFWYFVGERFGVSTLSNLLYLTRINRSVEEGFLYVLGSTYPMIAKNWMDFYSERYAADAQGRNPLPGAPLTIRNKRQLPLSQLKISPDGRQVAYVLNEVGRYKVYLQDVATGKRELVFRDGFRNNLQATDYAYPLLAWNPGGQELAVVYERRDKPYLLRYDLQNHKALTEELSTEFQRVHSIDYVNPTVLTISATVRGFSDIFLYFPATRQSQRITSDIWDDLDVVSVRVRNRRGLLFASNRPDSLLTPTRLDTVLPIQTFDVFYYDLENQNPELVRVTHTPLANERQPMAIDTSTFSYLSDASGVYNRHRGRLEEYIHHYEQRITLQDGAEIVLPVDSTMERLDSSLIDTIVVYPVFKERAVSWASTNFDLGLLAQHASLRTGRVADLVFAQGVQRVYVHPLEPDSLLVTAPSTRFRDDQQRRLMPAPTPVAPPETPSDLRLQPVAPVTVRPEDLPAEKLDTSSPVIDIDNYLFQSQFDDPAATSRPTSPSPAQPQPSAVEEVVSRQPTPTPRRGQAAAAAGRSIASYRFRPGRIVPYRAAFRTDYVTFNADNNLLFEGFDSYAANPDGFNTQPLGLLLKGNFKDLLEDYIIEGGLRLPTTFNGTEYFLVAHDRKRRLDRYFAVYRRNLRFPEEGPTFVPWRRENNVVLGQFGVRYPLDIFRSLRATATIRRDRVQLLGTDNFALNVPEARTQRVGMRLEYVFDNTLDLALNLRQGTRYKVFGEVYKSFALDFDQGFNFGLNQGYLGMLGIDFRHYLRLDKRSILAVRMAGVTSFGPEKILFYLGGTDNNLIPRFNRATPRGDDNFGLTALANNLRGFDLNARNGNSYALLNAELRAPIFRYFSERIRSPFFRNFQLVGFFDVGTAWSGQDPYSDENPLNTSFFPENGEANQPVRVRVVYFRDPIIAGYGLGARSLLFGYLIRLDYAWGIETRQVLAPKWHLSMGMDF